MKKINGFSFIEVLAAFSIVMMLAFTILPIISLLIQEETILSDRRIISNRLHDELQSVIWTADPYPSSISRTIRSRHVEFTFMKEKQFIKGCGYWINIKEREEKVCLYGVKEK